MVDLILAFSEFVRGFSQARGSQGMTFSLLLAFPRFHVFLCQCAPGLTKVVSGPHMRSVCPRLKVFKRPDNHLVSEHYYLAFVEEGTGCSSNSWALFRELMVGKK